MSELVLVTVPIGNLEDITLNALDLIKKEKMFLCEDTRVFKQLLSNLNISYTDKTFVSFHDHSEDFEVKNIIKKMKEGTRYILVSDAGSPIISDPGHRLVKACIENGVKVKSASGITSVISALELSGFAPIPFTFHGFFPQENNKKETTLQKITTIGGTHLFFEGPSRVKETLEYFSKEIPLANIVVARELTKKFETLYRFTASDFHQYIDENIDKGEIVLLINNPMGKTDINARVLKELAEEVLEYTGSSKSLSKLLAEILNRPSKEIYQLLAKKEK